MPADVSTSRRAAPKTITALSNMELRGTVDVATYANAARDICRSLAMEFDLTAHELNQQLDKAGGGLRDRFTARFSARRTAGHLRRAAAHANAAGDSVMRMWQQYQRDYEQLIHPQRRRDGWQFEEK